MSFASDVAAQLVSLNLATGVDTDIFLGSKAKIPSKPENVGPYISLIDTGGAGAVLRHDGRYARPSVQVVVRAASSVVANAKANALFLALADKFNFMMGSTFYLKVLAVQEVMDLTADELGRPRWGFNLNGFTR